MTLSGKTNGWEYGGRPAIFVPVLIVGGGPTGLLMGYMLSQLGVRSLIIERYPSRLAAPKAHALSPRSLELCRQFGLDINAIRKLGTSRKDGYWVNFLTSLAGDYVGSLPYERMDAEVLAATPLMIHNIAQPTFEEFVTMHLEKREDVEIRKNHSFVSCKQCNGQVSTIVEDRTSGSEYEIRSWHVIACDGAKSTVRSFLNIASTGESSYETMMTIHFQAKLRPLVGKQVGMLHWILNPDVSGFIISYDIDGNQVLICSFDPEKLPVQSWNEEVCRKTVTAAIGSDVDFHVLSYRPWVLSRKVADSYRSGNVFLAGDAAHSFPPTGGLGLNSGLADVHNLAYKIAAVHQGWGGSKLLDTYQADRRQIALVNSQQSVRNGQKVFDLLRARGRYKGDLTNGIENLHERPKSSQTRWAISKAVEGQREHFDNLGLHIGYVYGDTEVPASASLYIPAYRPGARLPHAWITDKPAHSDLLHLPPIDSSYVTELMAADRAAKEYSTLDLCSYDAFTLITRSASQTLWTEIVRGVRFKLPKAAAKFLKINVMALGKDFDLVPGARAEEWISGLRLCCGSGVLVRPDQHILDIFGSTANVDQVSKSLCEHLDLA